MCKQVDSTVSYYMWYWALLLTLLYSSTELDNTRQTQSNKHGCFSYLPPWNPGQQRPV